MGVGSRLKHPEAVAQEDSKGGQPAEGIELAETLGMRFRDSHTDATLPGDRACSGR